MPKAGGNELRNILLFVERAADNDAAYGEIAKALHYLECDWTNA